MGEWTGAELYLLAVVGTALALFLRGRPAPDLVAMLVLLALALPGVVSPQEALAGFSSSAVITLLGLSVITAALERTGVVARSAAWLAQFTGTSELRLLVVMMTAAALLSLVMNNIAAGAVLLPAAIQVARQANVQPARILLPISFGTLLGGMATIFTTANILLSELLVQQGYRPLGLFDFLPTGGLIMVAGIAYMALIGRHLLSDRESPASIMRQFDSPPDLSATYRLDERLWDVRIAPGSALVGSNLNASRIGAAHGITVLGVQRNSDAILVPTPASQIAVNDTLLVLGREERVAPLGEQGAQITPSGEASRQMAVRSLYPAEIIIAPRAPFEGQTLTELAFRTRTGVQVIAIWRGSRSYRTDVGTMPLQAGDALLVQGDPAAVRALADEDGFVVLDTPRSYNPDPHRALLASGIAIVAIVLSAAGWLSTPIAMLLGAILLVVTGIFTMQEIYHEIDWRVIFLVAGMTPLSAAFVSTGLAERAGTFIVERLAPYSDLVLVGGLAMFAMLIGQAIGGQITALVVGPLALTAAAQAGIDPVPVAVAVAIACSASFLTPIAHPVNLLMVTPGSYTGADFLRVGLGMVVVWFTFLMLGMWLFWGIV